MIRVLAIDYLVFRNMPDCMNNLMMEVFSQVCIPAVHELYSVGKMTILIAKVCHKEEIFGLLYITSDVCVYPDHSIKT